MEVIYKSDTRHRKQWFTGLSFSHPAKMVLPLQLWLIENFTKPGETILDPMAGSGTILVACSLGRHVVTVELENKFVEMQKGNWLKIRERGPQMGYQMGTATILQGDARDLEGLVLSRAERILVDKIISSLPYEQSLERWTGDKRNKLMEDKGLHAMPKVDKIVTSPPYEGSDVSQTHMTSNDRGNPANPNYRPSWKAKLAEGYAETKRPYSVDSIMCSPPYEAAVSGTSHSFEAREREREWLRSQGKSDNNNSCIVQASQYSSKETNIGNLKSDSYLAAMLQVYQQCFCVLKPHGLLILVTKNFIRNKQEVRLDLDTIKLCEQAGFTFQERHYRKLTTQSFWRVIYSQKYPDAPVLDKEDILIFSKRKLSV